MRDFYDLYELTHIYKNKINQLLLKDAFYATCAKRSSLLLLTTGPEIISILQQDFYLMGLWASYQQKFSYADEISYEDIMHCIQNLYEIVSNV